MVTQKEVHDFIQSKSCGLCVYSKGVVTEKGAAVELAVHLSGGIAAIVNMLAALMKSDPRFRAIVLMAAMVENGAAAGEAVEGARPRDDNPQQS